MNISVNHHGFSQFLVGGWGGRGVICYVGVTRDGGVELGVRFAEQGVLVVFVTWAFLKETMAITCHVSSDSQCDYSYEWTIMWHTNWCEIGTNIYLDVSDVDTILFNVVDELSEILFSWKGVTTVWPYILKK